MLNALSDNELYGHGEANPCRGPPSNRLLRGFSELSIELQFFYCGVSRRHLTVKEQTDGITSNVTAGAGSACSASNSGLHASHDASARCRKRARQDSLEQRSLGADR